MLFVSRKGMSVSVRKLVKQENSLSRSRYFALHKHLLFRVEAASIETFLSILVCKYVINTEFVELCFQATHSHFISTLRSCPCRNDIQNPVAAPKIISHLHRFSMVSTYWTNFAPAFIRNEQAGFAAEFARLTAQKGWKSQTKAWRRERIHCYSEEFKSLYGTSNQLEGWVSLCAEVGATEIPGSITQAKKVPLLSIIPFNHAC